MGRVVCQDGKIVFVRDGIELIRVSVNRLVKAGREYGKNDENMVKESRNERDRAAVSDDDFTDMKGGASPNILHRA